MVVAIHRVIEQQAAVSHGRLEDPQAGACIGGISKHMPGTQDHRVAGRAVLDQATQRADRGMRPSAIEALIGSGVGGWLETIPHPGLGDDVFR